MCSPLGGKDTADGPRHFLKLFRRHRWIHQRDGAKYSTPYTTVVENRHYIPLSLSPAWKPNIIWLRPLSHKKLANSSALTAWNGAGGSFLLCGYQICDSLTHRITNQYSLAKNLLVMTSTQGY